VKLSLLTTSCVVAVAALAAGCSNMHSSAMGASSETTQCKDGTSLPGHSRCALHGGVAQPGSAGSSSSSSTSGSGSGR
jgi:hypothetical protein